MGSGGAALNLSALFLRKARENIYGSSFQVAGIASDRRGAGSASPYPAEDVGLGVKRAGLSLQVCVLLPVHSVSFCPCPHLCKVYGLMSQSLFLPGLLSFS